MCAVDPIHVIVPTTIPGNFTVETRNAGIGHLLIRVHGRKDSFKIVAPTDPHDKRTVLVSYNPRMAGEYTIYVRWSGSMVPGLPFRVQIDNPPGEKELVLLR